jgi:hypothetical protein
MNRGTQFQFIAGLALVLSIVAAARVAAHSPLPGALDLPLHIGDAAALRPWNHPPTLIPPMATLRAPGRAQLLPNWEVGRNAAMLLPNYEPGSVTFELLEIGAISSLAAPTGAPPVAPHATPIDADKP